MAEDIDELEDTEDEENSEDEESEEQGESEDELEEDEEKDLEELAESPQAGEDFSEFMTGSSEMPTATLQTGEMPSTVSSAEPENLEGTAADAPIIPEEQKTEADYITVYNAPDYSGMEEEKIVEDMRKRGTMTRTVEQLRETPRRVMIEEDDELRAVREQQERVEGTRDYVVEVERREDSERKLPFQQERKYREKR